MKPEDEVIMKAVRLHNASCFTRTISQSSVSFANTTINKEPSVYARDSGLVCACASGMKTVAISLPVCPVVFTLSFIFLLHNRGNVLNRSLSITSGTGRSHFCPKLYLL